MNQNEKGEKDYTKWIEIVAKADAKKVRTARVLALIARFQPASHNFLFKLTGIKGKSTFQKIIDGLYEQLKVEIDESSNLRIKPKYYSLKSEKQAQALNAMGGIVRDFESVVDGINKVVESKPSIPYNQVGFYMYLFELYIAMMFTQKMIYKLDDTNLERQYVYDDLFHFAELYADYLLMKIGRKISKQDYDRAVNYIGELLDVFYVDKLLNEFIILLKDSLKVEKDEHLAKTLYINIAHAVMHGASRSFTGQDKNITQVIKQLEKRRDYLLVRRYRFGKNLEQHLGRLQKLGFARLKDLIE